MGLLNFLNRRQSADAAAESSINRQFQSLAVSSRPTSRGPHPPTLPPSLSKHLDSETSKPSLDPTSDKNRFVGLHSANGNNSRTLEEWQQSSSSWNQSRNAAALIESSTGGSSVPVKPRLVGITEGQAIDGPYHGQPDKRPKSSHRIPRDAARGLTITIASDKGEKSRLSRDRASENNLLPPASPFRTECASPGPPARRPSLFVDLLDARGEIRNYDFRSRVQASGTRDYGEDVADRNMRDSISTCTPLTPSTSSSLGAPLPFRSRGSFSAASVFRSSHRGDKILEESAIPHRGSDAQSLSSRSAMKEGSYSRQSSIAISLRQPDTPVTQSEPISDIRLQCISPRQVLRSKQRQFSLPTDQAQPRITRGSVRAAREALLASEHARARAGRSESPARLLPHQRLENYYDWSRFNKSTWDDASSAHSDGPRISSLKHSLSTRSKPEGSGAWTPQRQGSSASSVPPLCDPSSPRFFGSRSIHTSESSSIDLPPSSLFGEMRFGASTRSLRSRGGDSLIAPDDDSCGDSVFISPATPAKDGDLSPICGKALDGGFAATGFDSTTIYDSDAESIRGTRRQWLRPDGESLFRDDKNLTEMFEEAKSLPSSKWADILPTRTNASELGDDERSVAEEPLQRLRQNSTRPFTQRERMLALGYDYDSDSDVEASMDSDEIPEERALMLLNTLIVSGGSQAGAQGEQKVNMNTVAKLRREIRKRRRTGAAGRRVGRIPENVDHQDDESRDETK